MTTTLTPQRKNPKERSLRARPLLWLLIAAISTWLLPQKAVCGNFVDEPHNYQLMLNGANTIRFKVPVFNEDMADHWVYDGYIYVSVEDENGNFGQDKILFGWNNYEGNHDNDRDYAARR